MSCATRSARPTPTSRSTRPRSSSSRPGARGPRSSTIPSRSSRACRTRPSRASPAWPTIGCSGAIEPGRGRARPRLRRRHRPADRRADDRAAGPGDRRRHDAGDARARAASARAMGLDNVELHEALIESLPLKDASVDVVISNGVIDLVPDKDAVFDEIDRVLRPGGTAAARRRGHPPRGLRGRAQAHRSLDRLNRRRAAPRRARAPAGAAGLHRHHPGRPRRHLRPVGLRGHAAQGREVRRHGVDHQGDQAALSAELTAVGARHEPDRGDTRLAPRRILGWRSRPRSSA